MEKQPVKKNGYSAPCTLKVRTSPQDKGNRMARLLYSYTGEAYDDRANVIDALTDIRHMCDIAGIDYYAACTMSYQHYLAEKGNII